MQEFINVSYPSFLANSLKLNGKDFEQEIRISSLAKLFELGRISSGIAAKVLGLSRVEFLDMMVKYKVSIIEVTSEEIKEDYLNA